MTVSADSIAFFLSSHFFFVVVVVVDGFSLVWICMYSICGGIY